MTPSRHSGASLDEVARRLAPNLRIISASQPTPLLRDHNVLFVARDADTGRRAVLALESLEHADDQLGTVVMGSGEAAQTPVVDRRKRMATEALIPKVSLARSCLESSPGL